MFFAQMLKAAMNSERDENPIADAAMSSLVELLESCDERKRIREEYECGCPEGAELNCVNIMCPRK